MVWTREYQLFVLCDRPGEGSRLETVGGDSRFYYLSGSHLQSQVKSQVKSHRQIWLLNDGGKTSLHDYQIPN